MKIYFGQLRELEPILESFMNLFIKHMNKKKFLPVLYISPLKILIHSLKLLIYGSRIAGQMKISSSPLAGCLQKIRYVISCFNLYLNNVDINFLKYTYTINIAGYWDRVIL